MRPHLLLLLPLLAAGCFELDLAEDGSGGDGGGGAGCPPNAAGAGGAVGQIGPDLALEDGTGETFRLWDRCGRVTLLAIGAGWCVSCREEVPTLVAWHDELSAAGFEVYYGLFQDDLGAPAGRSFARGWQQEYGCPFPVVTDPLDRIRTRYRLTELDLPLTVLLDRGMVVRLAEGNLDPPALRAQIDALLAE